MSLALPEDSAIIDGKCVCIKSAIWEHHCYRPSDQPYHRVHPDNRYHRALAVDLSITYTDCVPVPTHLREVRTNDWCQLSYQHI